MNPANVLSNLASKRSPYSVLRRLYRFFYWQLIRKRIPSPFYFTLPDGARMQLRAGESGTSGFYYYGYPDYEEMMFLRKLFRPGDLFVDVGANSGGWALTCFGLGARVIAIEPVSTTYARLAHNFEVNGGQALKAVRSGVSDKPGVMTLSTDSDTGNHVVVESSVGPSEIVAVTTLDELLVDEEPVVIKIDVEGHEEYVIKGAQRVLKRPTLKALIIETFRWANYNSRELLEIEANLNVLGFRAVRYDPVLGKVVELAAQEGGQNTIYVRD